MSSLVLDCSVVMAWCFSDEASARADAALEETSSNGAVVPSIWPLEVQNVLLVAERRARLDQARSARFLQVLGALPIHIDRGHAEWPAGELMSLARTLKLSAYDAAYIELAMRLGVPLATLDGKLKKAAGKVGVPVFK